MNAYLIVDTKISNPDAYEEYKRLAKPIAEQYGGVYRTRGGAMDVCETDLWAPTRIVIIAVSYTHLTLPTIYSV